MLLARDGVHRLNDPRDSGGLARARRGESDNSRWRIPLGVEVDELLLRVVLLDLCFLHDIMSN